MIKLSYLTLRILHKLYVKVSSSKKCMNLDDVCIDYQEASNIIKKYLISEQPFMVSRFGAVEISALTNYLGIKSAKHSVLKYIMDKEPQWWWNDGVRYCMKNNAGFFPNTDENLCKFSELILNDLQDIDILISWQPDEYRFISYMKKNIPRIHYVTIDSFMCEEPWTYYLKGKKVLVVHPFAQEIEDQYRNNRTKLFKNPKVLPEFKLITYPSVQSIGGNSLYKSWFDALKKMENDISTIDFDICLLGCGAYGMPLAAYIKRMGKTAIHIGGSLQLLFGIRGARWEDSLYGIGIHHEQGAYCKHFNEHWIRPYKQSMVKNSKQVDNGCYW